MYIDPGTGSMLFSLATGLITAVWFGVRKLYMSTKYLTTGKAVKDKAKKDIIIYGEDKRYWTTFKAILGELDKSGLSVTYLAGSEDDPLLSQTYEHVETKVIGLGNKAYARLNLLNAYVCLATTPGLDVYQWKRSKSVDWYVHIVHAAGSGTIYRMFGTQFFDAIMYSADRYKSFHREIEAKRGSAPKELVTVGQPHLDYMMERKNQTKTPPHDGINVLVAPSWGTKSLLNKFGDALLDSLIATGFDITLRPHPQSFITEKELMAHLRTKYPENEHFHWNSDADNFNILNASDIMISDYSGVIADFAYIFERPVIYVGVELDGASLDEAWLNHPYDGMSVLPRIGRELKEADLPAIGVIIADMVGNPQYVQSIRTARDENWQQRGLAAKNVADYLIKKCEELKVKPEN